jgi:hypothetical protein
MLCAESLSGRLRISRSLFAFAGRDAEAEQWGKARQLFERLAGLKRLRLARDNDRWKNKASAKMPAQTGSGAATEGDVP